MLSRRDQRVAIVSLVLAVATLGGAGLALHDRLLEAWYLPGLNSDCEYARRAAAARLEAVRSARAVPRLIDLAIPWDELAWDKLVPPSRLIRRSPLIRRSRPHPAPGDERPSNLPPDGAIRPEHVYYQTVLVKIGDRSVPGLVQVLARRGPRVREWALEILQRIGREAVPVLNELRRSDDGGVRNAAAFALAAIEKPR